MTGGNMNRSTTDGSANTRRIQEDCRVGDIMYQHGQSGGFYGKECVSETDFIGVTSTCNNGVLEEVESTMTCDGAVPNCFQCDTPGRGAAICISATERDGCVPGDEYVTSGFPNGDCLVGDIMYQPGDDVGHIGYECMDGTDYRAISSTCSASGNGQIEETEVILTCDQSVPNCFQCGEPSRGAAICISSDTRGGCVSGDEYATNPSDPSIGTTVTTTATTMESGTTNGGPGCLVGDIMYSPGDDAGYLGYECLSGTEFRAMTSKCSESGNGQIEETEVTMTCDAVVPNCFQCGEPGIGAAICVSADSAEGCTEGSLYAASQSDPNAAFGISSSLAFSSTLPTVTLLVMFVRHLFL